jgi:hypothetical protein
VTQSLLFVGHFFQDGASIPMCRLCVLDPGPLPRGEVPGRLPPDRLREHVAA